MRLGKIRGQFYAVGDELNVELVTRKNLLKNVDDAYRKRLGLEAFVSESEFVSLATHVLKAELVDAVSDIVRYGVFLRSSATHA